MRPGGIISLRASPFAAGLTAIGEFCPRGVTWAGAPRTPGFGGGLAAPGFTGVAVAVAGAVVFVTGEPGRGAVAVVFVLTAAPVALVNPSGLVRPGRPLVRVVRVGILVFAPTVSR